MLTSAYERNQTKAQLITCTHAYQHNQIMYSTQIHEQQLAKFTSAHQYW